jgi:hypothetical protein
VCVGSPTYLSHREHVRGDYYLQNRIQALLGDLSVEEIETRRRAMFEDFIQASNTRLLFRDTIIESEYDPLVGRNYTLHYDSKSLSDPCKAALVKVRAVCC